MSHMGDYYSATGAPHITKDHCQQFIDHSVHVTMKDGNQMHAILIDVDDQNIVVLVWNMHENQSMMREQNEERFFGHGFRPGFGFRRLALPLAGIAALSVLPFAFYPRYPFYYPPFGYPFY